MENLKLNLKKYLQAARAATAMNDFDGAREYLVHAAECTLMLAKESSGVARNKYLSDHDAGFKYLEKAYETGWQGKW